MAYVLSLLAALACPIMMGFMVWMMMRRGKRHDADQVRVVTPSDPMQVAKRNRLIDLCLNWKVVAGLAVVGFGVWVVAPNLIWAALPVLILLACPLSMLFMMRGMGGGRHTGRGEPAAAPADVGRTHEQ